MRALVRSSWARLAFVISFSSALAAGLAWTALHRGPAAKLEAGVSAPSASNQRGASALGEAMGTTISGSFLLVSCKHFQVSAERLSQGGIVRLTFTENVPPNFAEASVPSAPGTTAGVHKATFDSEVSFFPKSFSSRGGNDLFLAGPPVVSDATDVAGGGVGLGSGTVLERWTITAPIGAPYTIRPASTVPIGTQAPLSSLSAQIPGGMYVPAEQRSAPRLRKTMLGYFGFSVSSIEADPEGRYVLLLSPAESKVYRLDLVNYNGNPVVILDGTAQPCLAFAHDVYACRFQDQLKRYVIGCSNGQNVVLRDSDNNGLFESAEILSDSAFYASPLYGNYDGITESYHNYTVVGLFP